MADVLWTEEAKRDLRDLLETATSRSERRGADLRHQFEAIAYHLERHPQIGRTSPELSNPAVRDVVIDRFRLVYYLSEDLSSHSILCIVDSRVGLL